MPIKVVDPDTGVETEAFTAEEVAAQTAAIQAAADAKIADNESHLKTKLDEFQKGKTATELEKEAEKNKTIAEIAEARRIAEEAAKTVAASETRRLESLKKAAIASVVGNDPELTKKLEESWGMINFDAKEESDFFKKAEMAANMSGLNRGPGISGMSFGGNYAPAFNQKKNVDEVEHSTFRGALPGMDDFLKGKEEKK